MAVTKQKIEKGQSGSFEWPFGTKNYVIFGLALIDIILGFVLLNAGDITWAPILLVSGFCVLVPLAIIVDGLPKSRSEKSTPPQK